MQTSELLNFLRVPLVTGSPEQVPEVTHIAIDSRQVQKNGLFLALPSSQPEGIHGSAFISQAIQNGAGIIVSDINSLQQADLPSNVLGVGVEDPFIAASQLAHAFYPQQPENIVAVTGTDGKSSVVQFTQQLWEILGFNARTIGTLSPAIDGVTYTTPDWLSLHKLLQQFHQDKVSHVAMEASSHGLAQHRMDNVDIKAAGFTSFGQDHLDYHGDIHSYFNAKRRLFDDLLPEKGVAVLNADIPVFGELRKAGRQVISYGTRGVDLGINRIRITPKGQDVSLSAFCESFDIHLPLLGKFQVYNVLCAAGLAIAAGADVGGTIRALETVRGVRGRLEHVGRTPSEADVYVDYAHTPEALENILRTVRPHCSGQLHVVFGCGGDRDPIKRPRMGAIANELADYVYITDDNPRSEDPKRIQSAIAAACTKGVVVPDRKKAIHKAMDNLVSGDILIVAGKGHETTQIIGNDVLPFDDADIIRKAGAAPA